MVVLGSLAGRDRARASARRRALSSGSAIAAAAFALLARRPRRTRYDMLSSAALLGIGIGLAFAALGNLIVQAVPPHQTGVAGGMNTVMRTLGGALGGQIAATFIADQHRRRRACRTVTGFTETFVMATGFLVVCTLAALLVPGRRTAPARHELEPALTLADN